MSAHRRALETGGLDGIANLPLVQSAIERPYSGYYRPIARKAAALVESVAGNHGFVDGNKRTALILMHTLLAKSGYRLAPLPGETLDVAVEEMVLGVVTHDILYDGLVEWFRTRLRKRV